MNTAKIKQAESILGGPVRIIGYNATLQETTFALASEAVGCPVNWQITRTVTL